MTWEEPASCTGPWGERHVVRVGSDGRVCYFGECDEPGEWTLEHIPFPSEPCSFDICCAPNGTPYVAGICDTGEVFLAWRNGEDDWECDSIGKNALYDECIEVEARDDHCFQMSFYCWNPSTDGVEHKVVEYGRRFCNVTFSEPSDGHGGGHTPKPAPKGRRAARKR